MTENVPISAIIPTWKRSEKLIECINSIIKCKPSPGEVLVHVDAGDSETIRVLKGFNVDGIRFKASDTNVGPGGGRNWLVKNAMNQYLASFDDDSWPMDIDFFARALKLLEQRPKAAVISLKEIRGGNCGGVERGEFKRASSFQNGACLMRRNAFLEIMGYVPLRYAYGMEEADVALQLMDKGWEILRYDGLRVFHDSDLKHQASLEINAAHIRNIGLLAFLRYPVILWPLGIFQVMNRVRYAILQKRISGIVSGVASIPEACWRYRKYRRVVKMETIKKSRAYAR